MSFPPSTNEPSVGNNVEVFERVSLQETKAPTHTIVDTAEGISAMIDEILQLPTNPPSLYIDVEGVNLSRTGTVSIIQIHARPKSHTYLVDVTTLGDAAFTTPSTLLPRHHHRRGRAGGEKRRPTITNPKTLKKILQSPHVPKVFFDVRSDSAALHARHGVRLRGVHDVQLMELATRSHGPRGLVAGLSRCVEWEGIAGLENDDEDGETWFEIKEAGRDLFVPGRGGSYEVFDRRPLPPALVAYCVQDVGQLPRLWDTYDARMSDAWRPRVRAATGDRVALSQKPTFVDPPGWWMRLAPRGWASYPL